MTTTYPPELNSGTLPSWLPLPTVYPAVAGCTSAYFEPGGALTAAEIYLYSPNRAVKNCLPDVVTSW